MKELHFLNDKINDILMSKSPLMEASFSAVQKFVEIGFPILRDTRVLLKNKQLREEGNTQFDEFRAFCHQYNDEIGKLVAESKKIYPEIDKYHNAVLLFVDGFMKRKQQTKIPTEPIDYLNLDGIEPSDVDFIMKSLKNSWNKYLQIYGSTKVEIILN